MRICSVDGCENKHVAHGLCRTHYQRQKTHGNVNTVTDNRGVPIDERFDMKVETREGSDCHWWIGSKSVYGYFKYQGTSPGLAHRFAYERAFGKIPNHDSFHGICVCHKCDNPLCVNPEHLFLGTMQDNMDDMVKKGRQGRSAANTKLNEKKVLEIRKMISEGERQNKIAKIYNVSQSNINAIKFRLTWKHLP